MKFLEPFLAVIGAALLVMFGTTFFTGANYQFSFIGIVAVLALAYAYAWFRMTSALRDEIDRGRRGRIVAIAVAVSLAGGIVLVRTSQDTSERNYDLRAVFSRAEADPGRLARDFLALNKRLETLGFAPCPAPQGIMAGGLISQGMQMFWYQSSSTPRAGLRLRVGVHPEAHQIECDAMIYGSDKTAYDRAAASNSNFLQQLDRMKDEIFAVR